MSYGVTRSGWIIVAVGLLVSACGAERPNVGLASDAPEVTVLSQVPTYTQARSLTLDVKAEDVLEVTHAWCSVNNGSPIAATRLGAPEERTWTCTVDLAPNRANEVAIWAEDSAGHSGASGQPPYMQSFTVVHGDTALGVALNSSTQATYYDESKLTVGATGVYDRNEARLEVVGPSETIHKVATRLAARLPATTSASDLEGTNPDNLPWLQFAVTLTGSPLATATYSIDATAGSTTKTYSGELAAWRSPQSSAGAVNGDVYFNLPLDSVRIPLLTTAAGPVTLKVMVDVADEAGNIGGTLVPLTYQVIGPPLNIAIDAEYPKAGTPKSTLSCTIAGKTYGSLFDSSDVSTFGPEQQVRLVRLVVTNPASQPVALDLSGITNGSWSMTETWSGSEGAVIDTRAFNDYACPADNQTAMQHTAMYAATANGSPTPPDPGADSFKWTGVAASASLGSFAELRDDGSPLSPIGGRYIVPAATGSAPRVVWLYVTRPVAARLTGAPALGPAPYANDVGRRYAFASARDNLGGCCADGYRWTTFYLYEYSPNLLKASVCGLANPGPDSSLIRNIGQGHYCQPAWTSAIRCDQPDGWIHLSRVQENPYDEYGKGTPCTNCKACPGVPVGSSYCPSSACSFCGVCFCKQWAPAQVYNISTYWQQLSTATESVLPLTLTPVTQATDEAGHLYGSTSFAPVPITIGGTFTH